MKVTWPYGWMPNINGENNTGLTDNQAIDRWVDMSGNGHHASTYSTDSSPQYQLSGFNKNYKAVRFSGEPNRLVTAPLDFYETQKSTIFVVSTFDDNSNRSILHQWAPENNWTIEYYGDAFSHVIKDSGFPSISSATNYIEQPILITTTAGDSLARITINGSNHNEQVFNGYLQANQDQKLFIGGRSNESTRSFIGKISEVLIFDAALSSEERSKVQAYLAKKWGLTAKVDSDNDGFTDAVEYQLSSSAVDAASAPAGVPAALSKATLWLDANDASTIDRDRYNNVNTWSDKSGSGVELSTSTISGLVVYDPINAGINFNYQGMSSTNDFDAKHIYVVHKTVDELNYFVDLRKSSDNLPNAYFVPKFGKTWFNKVAVNGLGTTNDTLIHDNTLQVSKLSGPSSDTVNFSLYQRYKTFTDEPGKGTAYEVIAFDQDLTNEEEAALYTYFMNKWELSNVAIDTDGDGVTDTADAFRTMKQNQILKLTLHRQRWVSNLQLAQQRWVLPSVKP